MSYYFNKAYNWYFDIHPWRPTMEDYKRKNRVVKQINDMKQFKFKNLVIIEKSGCGNKEKIEMMNKLKSIVKTKTKSKINVENPINICPTI